MIPQVIAHRGNRSVVPENTLAAFAAAIEAGAQSVEMDIVRAKDGTPVVIHDETLDATTSGAGRVSDFSVEEIQLLDAGSWFDGAFAGLQVPTLAQFAQFMSKHPEVEILLEFKGDWDVEQTSSVVRILDEHGVSEQTILQSFSRVTIQSQAIVAPGARRGVLFISREARSHMGWGEVDPSWPSMSDLDALLDECAAAGVYTFNPFVADVLGLPTLVEKVHAAGLRTQVWTANDPQQWEQLVPLGVDGIITDRPDALVGWYAGRGVN